jgi:drug/metabolite transporter (DMT)-like permease
MMRERLNAGEWAGTALTVTGVAALAGADYHFSPQYFRGDLICFASMVLFASYLALGRRNRDFPSLWLYLVPLYFVAGLICFAVSLAFTHPLAVGTAKDAACLLGLAVMPTVIGHTILNKSMKHFGGQTVSLANLAQFIFAGVMAYFLLTPPEVPEWTFYVAAALVVAGAAVAVRYTPPPRPPAR